MSALPFMKYRGKEDRYQKRRREGGEEGVREGGRGRMGTCLCRLTLLSSQLSISPQCTSVRREGGREGGREG